MPSLMNYKKMLGSFTDGEARKYESAMIMESTWDEDIATRTCYFYDWYHDINKTKLNDMHPELDFYKIPMRVKYLVSASQTFDKDAVTYHLQMKPSQQCVVPYYDEFFKNRYDANYPCGLYVDIPDERGIYNRWLVVGEANYNDPQFPTLQILRCDKVIQYVLNGVKYNVPAVLRSQNSYNSGIWTDYKTTTVEDQQKFLVPLNRDTEFLSYNLRLIIDAPVLTEPRAWQISKVNRLFSHGLCLITCAQDIFDQHKDYIELDDKGNVVGMWADFYSSEIPPEDLPNIKPNIAIHGEFSWNAQSQLKVGGAYKKYTLTFYDKDEAIEFISDGNWSFTIDDIDANDLVSTIIDNNIIKVKFIGDNSYIGKILNISYTTPTGIIATVESEIVGL